MFAKLRQLLPGHEAPTINFNTMEDLIQMYSMDDPHFRTKLVAECQELWQQLQIGAKVEELRSVHLLNFLEFACKFLNNYFWAETDSLASIIEYFGVVNES